MQFWDKNIGAIKKEVAKYSIVLLGLLLFSIYSFANDNVSKLSPTPEKENTQSDNNFFKISKSTHFIISKKTNGTTVEKVLLEFIVINLIIIMVKL